VNGTNDPALIAAISGGAAIVGGLVGGGLGYRGVIRQMSEQRRLESLQYRRETYIAFLDVAQLFMHGPGVLEFGKQQWLDFIPRYEHALDSLRLVAIPDVIRVSAEVHNEFAAMVSDIEHEAFSSAKEARKAAQKQHQEEIRKAIGRLREEMRKDIGPSAGDFDAF
jgi:hypothetical protein